MKETAELSSLRGLGTKNFSATFQQDRRHLRGETLLLVLDTMLDFHCGCKMKNYNSALTVAGYPNSNNKKLQASTLGLKTSAIEKPPVNMETLFARAIAAVDSSLKNRPVMMGRIVNGPARIQLVDAQAWRQDTHLGQYTVASLFKQNQLVSQPRKLLVAQNHILDLN
jgi:hypothetical protein